MHKESETKTASNGFHYQLFIQWRKLNGKNFKFSVDFHEPQHLFLYRISNSFWRIYRI